MTFTIGTTIFVADGNGANQQLVDLGTLHSFEPTLSPDAARVAFTSDDGHLYVANVDGTGVRQITSSGRDSQPAWSPKGDVIAFQRRDETGRPEIYTVVPGSQERHVTFGGVNVYSTGPVWSPDGQQLAYISQDARGYSVAASNTDGTGWRTLTSPQPEAIDAPPAWSPDGTQIAFLDRNRVLDVVGADGQNLTTLAPDLGKDGYWLSWRGSGANVAVSLDDLDSPLARKSFTVEGLIRSTGALAATGVSLTVSASGARVVRARAGETTCGATCSLDAVAGDTELPIAVTVSPSRPGAVQLTVTATAQNDSLQTDNSVTRTSTVSSCTVLGTFDHDKIVVKGPATVCSLEGDDLIRARNGKVDTIDGGPGDDTAFVDRNDRVRHVEHVFRAKR